MRTRRLFVGLIAPAALFLLVGALATLQYHWVGQVSAADREQLRASLNRRAGEFADDFDREISRIYQGLQPPAATFDPGTADGFATKYEAWKSAARFPDLVKAVYFARPTTDGVDLFKFDPSLRTFEMSEWPVSLEPVRARLSGGSRVTGGSGSAAAGSVTAGPRIVAYSTSSVVPDVPALLIPVPEAMHDTLEPLKQRGGSSIDFLFALRVAHSNFVIELDRQTLGETVLPALADRHFPETGPDRYRVTVLDAKGEPILTRGLPDGQRIDPEKADASGAFFGLRIETLRDATVTYTATARGGAVVSTTGRSATVNPSVPPSRFSMMVDPRGGGPASAAPVQMSEMVRLNASGAWRVLLQHSAGSLDAAVAKVRQRNLLLSFGILGVLMVSVGLIVINARRSERLAAQQMDFVATVSHELRTPLAVIRSAAQNLSAGVVLDAKQAQRYGDLIEGEGKRLTEMVEQVLEYAGLSGNRRPVMARPVDVAAIVRDVVSSSSPLLDAEGFQVEMSLAADLPPVLADEAGIRRALQNLINNALKYAADGRWLGISARTATTRTGPEVQIAVSDRGRGIAAEDLAHIFEPFYRGRYALERQIHGNGLGLSLVRRIAEAHGGRITVASSSGSGSTFTLHVPADPAQPATSALIEPASDSAGPAA
jgi:signal transduction histidine kinase